MMAKVRYGNLQQPRRRPGAAKLYEVDRKPMSISMGLVICFRPGQERRYRQARDGGCQAIRAFLCSPSKRELLGVPGCGFLLVFPVDPYRSAGGQKRMMVGF